ncbi:SAC3/GANP/Nin1/mts3/eIF-3 p25 family-domain-containing protein [Phycomyces blakesleeanus]
MSSQQQVQQNPAEEVTQLTEALSFTASQTPAIILDSWPPSLQQYVEDVFNNCSADRRDQAELELRNLIIEKHRKGELLTTDWSEMDLPSKKKETFQLPPLAHTAEEEEKRRNRLRRFHDDSLSRRTEAPSLPAVVTSGTEPMDWDKQTIIGTSVKLEKQYLRLTSAPDPSTVRPLPILKQTLELLKDKWKAEQNYTYICDQFKSMRQDLTVQRIRDEFTVQVYEIHARIALEKGDLGEYNQCQSQLKQLYMLGIPGNVMEFTAYRILYFLHTQNWSDINSIMAEVTPEQKRDEAVQHALQVRSCLATSNYHRFFRLYTSAPNMGGYLMDQFIERERVQALIILCKACRPDLPLSFIQTELAFEDHEQLIKFLMSQNAHHLRPDPNLLDTKAACLVLLESAKRYKKIDIKGQM